MLRLQLKGDGLSACLVDEDGVVKADGFVLSSDTAFVETGDVEKGSLIGSDLRFEGKVV